MSVGSSELRSVRVVLTLVLPTSDHRVSLGSNPVGGEILFEPKWHFIAQSFSCSPLPVPWYDWNSVEKNVKPQTIHPSSIWVSFVSFSQKNVFCLPELFKTITFSVILSVSWILSLNQKPFHKHTCPKLGIQTHMSLVTGKPVFGSFRPGQTQTGLHSHRS